MYGILKVEVYEWMVFRVFIVWLPKMAKTPSERILQTGEKGKHHKDCWTERTELTVRTDAEGVIHVQSLQ